MGSAASKVDEDRSQLASKHDIPSQDISSAYDNTPNHPTPSSFHNHADTPNTGLHPTHKAGKYLALDCEMVGTGAPPYPDHVLARASVVNFHGEQVYDSYVLPPPGIEVKDYRTFVSGITPAHLQPGVARPFGEVQKDIAELLRGRVLVGHALRNDLRVLVLTHPPWDVRDTARYPKYRVESKGKPPALRNLALSELGVRIQGGEHSSVEDARAAMLLFRKERVGFEEECRRNFRGRTSTMRAGAKAAVGSKGGGRLDDGVLSEDEGGAEVDEADLALLDGEEEEGEVDSDVALSSATKGSSAVPKARKKHKSKKRTKRR